MDRLGGMFAVLHMYIIIVGKELFIITFMYRIILFACGSYRVLLGTCGSYRGLLGTLNSWKVWHLKKLVFLQLSRDLSAHGRLNEWALKAMNTVAYMLCQICN